MRKLLRFLSACLMQLYHEEHPECRDDKQLKWLRFLGSTKL